METVVESGRSCREILRLKPLNPRKVDLKKETDL